MIAIIAALCSLSSPASSAEERVSVESQLAKGLPVIFGDRVQLQQVALTSF